MEEEGAFTSRVLSPCKDMQSAICIPCGCHELILYACMSSLLSIDSEFDEESTGGVCGYMHGHAKIVTERPSCMSYAISSIDPKS